jgi:threonine dehydrogenase-like Zn-dependent dehydrogenase
MGILNADGSFAEYLAIPTANLHLVPDEVADEEAVFTEPLAAALAILEQVHIPPAAEVVILGDGKLGLLCAQALHGSGARVTLVGKHEAKLKIAQKLGVRTLPLAEWRSRRVDYVVEATGSTAGVALALEMVRPRGVLVLKSTVARNHDLSLAPLVVNEVTVVGSRCGLFPPALQALAEKRASVLPLINKVFSLRDGAAAVRMAARRGILKILLRNA